MLENLKFKALLVTGIVLFWALSVSTPSYAKGSPMDGGHGMGSSHGMGTGHGRGDGAASEKAEVQGTTESVTPPGLAEEGKMPSGLEAQDKTPAGWSKGKKKGWNKQTEEEEKNESREAEKHEKEKGN